MDIRLKEFNEQLDAFKAGNTHIRAIVKNEGIKLCLANSDAANDLEKAIDVIRAHYYEDEQCVNQVRACLGAILCQPDNRESLDAFNSCRDSWNEYISSIRKLKRVHEGKKIPLAKALMEISGNSRLHRVQMKRKFTVIEGDPIKLSYGYWDNSKQEPVARGELIDRAEAAGNKIAINFIRSVNDNVFSVIGKSYKSYKCNINYIDEDKKLVNKMIASTLPLVFITEKTIMPEVMIAKGSNTHDRTRDKIEESAFFELGSSKVHRYLKYV